MTLSLDRPPLPLRTDDTGTIRVGRTRVTLDTVVGCFCQGATAEEIACRFPTLDLSQIYGVIAYYLHNRPQVDAYLEERQNEAEQMRSQVEQRFDPHGVRERLLSRRPR